MSELQRAKDVYQYGLPIVGMYELFYKQIMDPNTKTTDLNEYQFGSGLANPKTSFIPAPNNDTIYNYLWMDLRNGPIVLETPDTAGRYFTMEILDLYSEVLGNLGSRVYGTAPHKFLIVGPHHQDQTYEGFDSVLYCKTSLCYNFMRILVNGVEDEPAAKKLQVQFKAYPLYGYGEAHSYPRYDVSDAKAWYQTLGDVLALSPSLDHEADILYEVRETLKYSEATLEEAIKEARQAIDDGGKNFGESCNYWRIARKGMGNYGDDYFQRAVVWYKGALANTIDESLYPAVFQDESGALVDGTHNYVLHFDEQDLPKVSEFWSLTLYYFKNAFLYDNEINRYSLGDRSPSLTYNADGSLDLYIQHLRPSEDKVGNWLPAPAEAFYLVLRLYGPDQGAMSGAWNPPALIRVDE